MLLGKQWCMTQILGLPHPMRSKLQISGFCLGQPCLLWPYGKWSNRWKIVLFLWALCKELCMTPTIICTDAPCNIRGHELQDETSLSPDSFFAPVPKIPAVMPWVTVLEEKSGALPSRIVRFYLKVYTNNLQISEWCICVCECVSML